MTPSEELKTAAMKIRDVAAKSTPGPWLNLDRGDRIVRGNPDVQGWIDGAEGKPQYVVDEPLYANPDNGEHIALWDPVVAELVAKQLDCWVEHFEHIEWINNRPGGVRTRIAGFNKFELAALDLARAINGEVKP